MSDRIANWNTATPSANTVAPLLPVQSDRHQDSRIIDFQRHLSRRGKEWDDINQLIFVRLYNQFNKRESRLIQSVCSEIPGIQSQTAKNHILWYIKFLKLDASKKEAISDWRTSRLDVAEIAQEEIIDVIQNIDESRAKAAEKESISRTEQKMKINGWKQVRQVDREKQERLNVLEKIAEKERKEVWRMEQANQRSIVKDYRQNQDKHDEIAKQATKTKNDEKRLKLRERSISVIEKSQQRAKNNSERILSIKNARQDQILKRKNTQDKIASQVEIVAKRDPSRLFRQTVAQAERAKKLTGDKLLIGEINAQYAPRILPHRSVPSWRVGL